MNNTQNLKKLTSLNKYVKSEIDKRITSFFDQKIKAATKIDPAFHALLSDMQRYILRGGKRLRPTLMILGYQAAGGGDIKKALDAALSLELFHNFVLIHDDVMDGDLRRYGGPNIAGIYQRRYSKKLPPVMANKTAESIAILAGELNEAFTFEVIAELEEPAKVRFALIRHFQKVLFETGAGQQLDVIAPTWARINSKKIDKINYYKTAQYTITSPLNFGVILADKHHELTKEFAQYGQELGAAFQLVDDKLGMFASSRQTGKPVGSDLREGKRTMLMCYAQTMATPLEWKAISARLGKPNLSNEDIKTVQSILKGSGAEAKVNVAIQDHLHNAITVVDKLPIDAEIRELLLDFAIYCTERKK